MTNPLLQTVNPSNRVIWTGASGKRYDTFLDPIWSAYLVRSGIYIFCRETSPGSWTAVYVGETDDFSRRLTSDLTLHHRWESIRAAGATHICTLHIPNDHAGGLRLQIETDLRHALNPPCNRQ
jgi:hypothetical protein